MKENKQMKKNPIKSIGEEFKELQLLYPPKFPSLETFIVKWCEPSKKAKKDN